MSRKLYDHSQKKYKFAIANNEWYKRKIKISTSKCDAS